mmetsp:Transcript_44937/g.82057  ORF Transcript_44937/g.82057 Transcript_44937/m.82057 type:complete len:710 (-) Transcript_44937:135-2264(-)
MHHKGFGEVQAFVDGLRRGSGTSKSQGHATKKGLGSPGLGRRMQPGQSSSTGAGGGRPRSSPRGAAVVPALPLGSTFLRDGCSSAATSPRGSPAATSPRGAAGWMSPTKRNPSPRGSGFSGGVKATVGGSNPTSPRGSQPSPRAKAASMHAGGTRSACASPLRTGQQVSGPHRRPNPLLGGCRPRSSGASSKQEPVKDKASFAKAVGSRTSSPRMSSPRGVNPTCQSPGKQPMWPCLSPPASSRGARPGSAPATPAPQSAAGRQRAAQLAQAAQQIRCNAARGHQSPKASGASSTPVPGFPCTSQMLEYLGLETPSVSASLSSDEDELDGTSIYEHVTPRDIHNCSAVLSAREADEDSVKLDTRVESQPTTAVGDISKGSIDTDRDSEIFAESRVDLMLGTTQGLLQALSAAVNPHHPSGHACRSAASPHSGKAASAALADVAALGKLPPAAALHAASGTPSTSTPTSACSTGSTATQLLDDLRFRVSHLELEFQRLQRSTDPAAGGGGGEAPYKAATFQQLLDAFHHQVGGICKQQAEVTQDLQHLRENIGGLASQVSSMTAGGAALETAGTQEEAAKREAADASMESSEKAAAPQAARLRTRSGSRIPVLLSGNLGNLSQAVSLDGLVSARLPGSVCAPAGSAARQAALLRSRFSTGSLPATPSVPQRYQHPANPGAMPFTGGPGLVRRLPSAPSQVHICPAAVRAG